MAPANQDCLAHAGAYAFGMSMMGVPVGFFRAHEALKKLTIQEKLNRWNNMKLTARVMANPMATFAACGAAYAAAECASQGYLGREDVLTGIIGGAAVGAVVGLKRGSLAHGVGYAGLFAGIMIVTDFYTQIAKPVLGGIKVTGEAPVKAA